MKKRIPNILLDFASVMITSVAIFTANAANAVRLNQIDWTAKVDWSDVGCCGIHDRCLLISNQTTGVVAHRSFARPQISSKVYKLEKKKKKKKAIKACKVFKAGKLEFDESTPGAYHKFWSLPLEEKKKYPLTLKRKYIRTRRAIELRAKFNEWRKKREKTGKRPPPPIKPRPYNKEEIETLGTADRRPTDGERLANARNGKVSNQSKVGNKVINLEVK